VTSFDYVIVGAGSAGCVLARRLSDDPRTTVLLIEAGPAAARLVDVPMGYVRMHRDPRVVWHLPLAAGEWPGGLIGGKVLGGTSAINSMLYVRGQPEDYDGWAAAGAPGWSWSDMLPCFKAMEDHELGASAVRGGGGPLRVTVQRGGDVVCEALVRAGVALGLPRREDLNGLDQEGVGYFPVTLARGRRISAARAFLDPIKGRANLTILTDALVTRVLCTGTRAVGVACTQQTVASRFDARREVIVCAGALQSPKLLQLSGIGPGDHLRALGVPVVCDSPGVGANLQDHWGLRLQHRLLRTRGHNARLRGVGLWGSRLRYMLSRTGTLAATGPEVGAFAKVTPGAVLPDAELQFARMSFDPATGAIERRPGLQCAVRSLRQESRGSVTLRSADPSAPPVIRGNFLSAEADCALAVRMVAYARRFLRDPALREHVGEETFPGPRCQSPDEVIDVCRRAGTPGSHFAGTCRMGEDRLAVVDPKLRVRGVHGLRVVDGSIMPTVVSGNTNGPIMAIAWRAAELIRADTA
jgi:choline dehydrogenase-like flavoprotein